jgi:hypothetical protein
MGLNLNMLGQYWFYKFLATGAILNYISTPP